MQPDERYRKLAIAYAWYIGEKTGMGMDFIHKIADLLPEDADYQISLTIEPDDTINIKIRKIAS